MIAKASLKYFYPIRPLYNFCDNFYDIHIKEIRLIKSSKVLFYFLENLK